jgi:hypothetical protein
MFCTCHVCGCPWLLYLSIIDVFSENIRNKHADGHMYVHTYVTTVTFWTPMFVKRNMQRVKCNNIMVHVI